MDQLIDGQAFLGKVQEIYGHPDSVSLDTLFFKDGRCFERYSQPQVIDDVSVGRVWSFRDVSERVAEEERRRKLEQQLHQSQTMEALGTLSAGIAHDFNNLLTVIIGQSELALATPPGGQERGGHLRDVLEAAHQASALVRQIREFSQPHLDTRAVVRVAEVVGPALDVLRSTFPSTIDLRILLDPDVAIAADRSQLQQVVTNLAVNARQAIGDRAGRIEITLDVVGPDRLPAGFASPASKAYAHLSVCDTGPGIPAEALDHVFEPFFTTKDVGRGRGLGLAVVHGIVQRHGGAVAVESDPGNGACFRVLLPVYSGLTTMETPDDGAPTVAATPRLRRVMVVDDDERVATVMAGLLGRLGHEATIRTDPVDALALFRGDPAHFDLVLTDLSMPQLSGLELGRQILAIRPDAAVVLLTGFSADLTTDHVRAMGFRELVHKPITLASLADLLHRAWGAEGDL
jgi:signal transduction histidine kinase/CheY-like chemotaxis protein